MIQGRANTLRERSLHSANKIYVPVQRFNHSMISFDVHNIRFDFKNNSIHKAKKG